MIDLKTSNRLHSLFADLKHYSGVRPTACETVQGCKSPNFIINSDYYDTEVYFLLYSAPYVNQRELAKTSFCALMELFFFFFLSSCCDERGKFRGTWVMRWWAFIKKGRRGFLWDRQCHVKNPNSRQDTQDNKLNVFERHCSKGGSY